MNARQTVLAWHAALNAGAVDQLLALAAADIEVGGPRGSGRGADLLREWFQRAGVRLDPLRVIDHDDTVVVEEDATWSADAQVQRVACVFRVQGGQISSLIRYPDLATALDAAGLSGDDQVEAAGT